MTARIERVRGLAGLVTLTGLAADKEAAVIAGLVVILGLTFLAPRLERRRQIFKTNEQPREVDA
ncbi:hypothetical protein LCGC14_0568070 [marine sediment metagenome]|uniref:Uncharacterized protein n=1 Tax=marine sediment metagenome TaxID=412755 RepID=A0A0F9S3R7_9ZZZZ